MNEFTNNKHQTQTLSRCVRNHYKLSFKQNVQHPIDSDKINMMEYDTLSDIQSIYVGENVTAAEVEKPYLSQIYRQ